MNDTIKISPPRKKLDKYTMYTCILGVWGLELRKMFDTDCLKTARASCKRKIDSEGVYGYTYGICLTEQWEKLHCKVVEISNKQ